MSAAGTTVQAGQTEVWDNLRPLWHRLWLILLCGLLAGLASYIVSAFFVPPLYLASTTLMVQTSDMTTETAVEGRFNDYDTFLANEYMTTTFQELALTQPVLAAAAATTGRAPDQLQTRLEVRAIPRTPLLQISFADRNPEQAMRVANSVATALIQVVDELEWMPGRQLAVIEAATLPQTPASPRILLNTLIAALAGALAALAGLFMIQSLHAAAHVQE
jgi:capsular polysaccharide biosynthesis protein